MQKLTQKNINDLPMHDSDFIGYSVSQKDNGQTKLILSIAFCEGEYEDLNQNSKFASLIFENCWWINKNIICNRTQRDSIDYIRVLLESQELKRFDKKSGLKHIEIVF
ncbi:MAG: hypothetical protein GY861_25965, partial [bacterium]|nr:hypothetical protein [bacterium]